MEGRRLLEKLREVYENYDFEVEKIIRGRGGYILYTSKGLKLLREYDGSVGKLDLEAKIKKGLKEDGFLHVDAPILTKEEEFLSFDKYQNAYTLKEYYDGKECNLKNVEDMKIAAGNLARLHQSFSKINDLWERKEWEPLSLVMQRRNQECKRVKNYIRSLNAKNEFEKLFLANVDYFYEQGEETKQRLSRLEQTYKEECEGICHGEYNQHNIVWVETRWQIINFENFVYNWCIMDLANFLRKMQEKNEWDIHVGNELLESYTKVRKLSAIEKEKLYGLLLFPEKFWKVANHYMNSRKNWVSEKDIEKLKKVIEQEAKRMKYLQNLFAI